MYSFLRWYLDVGMYYGSLIPLDWNIFKKLNNPDEIHMALPLVILWMYNVVFTPVVFVLLEVMMEIAKHSIRNQFLWTEFAVCNPWLMLKLFDG